MVSNMPSEELAQEVEVAREVARNFYANAIGKLAVDYIRRLEPDALCELAESEAVKMISRIKEILDEDDAADPECFQRIDSIVSEFEWMGIYTLRHQ